MKQSKVSLARKIIKENRSNTEFFLQNWASEEELKEIISLMNENKELILELDRYIGRKFTSKKYLNENSAIVNAVISDYKNYGTQKKLLHESFALDMLFGLGPALADFIAGLIAAGTLGGGTPVAAAVATAGRALGVMGMLYYAIKANNAFDAGNDIDGYCHCLGFIFSAAAAGVPGFGSVAGAIGKAFMLALKAIFYPLTLVWRGSKGLGILFKALKPGQVLDDAAKTKAMTKTGEEAIEKLPAGSENIVEDGAKGAKAAIETLEEVLEVIKNWPVIGNYAQKGLEAVQKLRPMMEKATKFTETVTKATAQGKAGNLTPTQTGTVIASAGAGDDAVRATMQELVERELVDNGTPAAQALRETFNSIGHNTVEAGFATRAVLARGANKPLATLTMTGEKQFVDGVTDLKYLSDNFGTKAYSKFFKGKNSPFKEFTKEIIEKDVSILTPKTAEIFTNLSDEMGSLFFQSADDLLKAASQSVDDIVRNMDDAAKIIKDLNFSVPVVNANIMKKLGLEGVASIESIAIQSFDDVSGKFVYKVMTEKGPKTIKAGAGQMQRLLSPTKAIDDPAALVNSPIGKITRLHDDIGKKVFSSVDDNVIEASALPMEQRLTFQAAMDDIATSGDDLATEAVEEVTEALTANNEELVKSWWGYLTSQPSAGQKFVAALGDKTPKGYTYLYDSPLSAVFSRTGHLGLDAMTATKTDRIYESLKRRNLSCLY